MPPPAVAGSVPTRHSSRWAIAEQVGHALRQEWGSRLLAVGVHGALAHGDDDDGASVDIVAVTRKPYANAPSGARRIDGVIVDLSMISEPEYLRHACTLTTSWPLLADRYISTRAVIDPDGWFAELRNTHLAFLAQIDDGAFASLAREAWCRAQSAQIHARRLAERHEHEASMAILGEARLAAALVHGLLTRTYYRNRADAVRRARVATANVYDLGERLIRFAQDLAARGRPVDGDIADLIGC